MRGDCLPQWGDAERVGIADAVFGERAPGRLADRRRRLRPRLADFEMDYPRARCLALIGGAQHVHRDEGRHEAAPCGDQAHAGAHPAGFKTRPVEAG